MVGPHNFMVHISSPIVADIIAAENTLNPGLIYDIEGNFILVAGNLCLKEIKKKMVGPKPYIYLNLFNRLLFSNISLISK